MEITKPYAGLLARYKAACRAIRKSGVPFYSNVYRYEFKKYFEDEDIRNGNYAYSGTGESVTITAENGPRLCNDPRNADGSMRQADSILVASGSRRVKDIVIAAMEEQGFDVEDVDGYPEKVRVFFEPDHSFPKPEGETN